MEAVAEWTGRRTERARHVTDNNGVLLPNPTRFSELRAWSEHYGIPAEVARRRFAQAVMLRAIAASPVLRRQLVLKGGNALDFVLAPNRSTIDIDFTIIEAGSVPDPDSLAEELDRYLSTVTRPIAMIARVQSRKRQPKTGGRFGSITLNVGYALPDQSRALLAMEAGRNSSTILPIEISFNDPICATEERQLDASNSIKVATLEDIVAEKLRALLQQEIRNRGRRQDLLDLAVVISGEDVLNGANVATFLQIKAEARDIYPSKVAFRSDELFARARIGYDQLANTARRTFIPFEEARTILLEFVDQLPIPDR